SFLTIILLSISLALLLRSNTKGIELKYRVHLYALAYVMLIYILREADFHRLFTDEHITRGKFYTDPTINWQQKILGGIPLALFFIFFISLTISHTKLILSKTLQAAPWAISTVLWGTTMFLSQLADKSSLNDFYQGRVIEESLELCASGYVLLTIIQAGPLLKNYLVPKIDELG
ncbi:MAG: hypothetical protein AB8B89_06075, partial [Gammaproteobacteria bacterium]